MEITAAVASIRRLERECQYGGGRKEPIVREECRDAASVRQLQLVLKIVEVAPQQIDIEGEAGDDRNLRGTARRALKQG